MKWAIVGIAFFVLAVSAPLHAGPSPLEQQLFDLVNREREKAGLSRLEWNDRLAQAALAHSRLLDQHQELSHQFDGEAPLPERVGVTGARFNAVAENVAEAQEGDGARTISMKNPASEVANAHAGLMGSPGHRANILNTDYNAVGISIVQHGQKIWVTQDFAHILASYTEKQFRDAVVTSFNKARRARGLPAMAAVPDNRLRSAACAQEMNAEKMIEGLPGAATLLVFSLSEPGTLPNDLRKAAADKTLDRMNVGVCLQTGGRTGFSKFWVVAAFFRSAE